jgi:hypothetical protein
VPRIKDKRGVRIGAVFGADDELEGISIEERRIDPFALGRPFNSASRDGRVLRLAPAHPGGDLQAATDDLPASDLPPVEAMSDRPHRAGWSIGETTFAGPQGLVWFVSGQDSENLIRAEVTTRVAAWWASCQQAEAVGRLGRW